MAAIPLNQLTIKKANPSQIDASRHLTWLEWSRGRTIEEYMHEHADVDAGVASTTERYHTWVLVPRDEPDTLDFLSSCETYRRTIFIKAQSQVKESVGYGIASVFTRPAFRGKGYASHMMHLLHWNPGAFPPENLNGDAVLSVLYSDVGGFYERCGPGPGALGWVSTERRSAIWPAHAEEPPLDGIKAQILNQDSIWNLIDVDDHLIIDKELAAASSPELCFSYTQGRKRQNPGNFGVFAAEGEQNAPGAALAYAVWTFEMKPHPSRLIICRLRATPQTFPIIIKAAQREAKMSGVEIVEVWNLPTELESLVQGTGGRVIERDDHWPCMAWYGLPEVPETMNLRETVKWVNNEK
ncbi:hypothetical protein FRB90_005713 [Tulasnella sp. 427]|nr:hypothetical protein FRB90_005713 [Tulasnella sp. 427]